ncbi:MAG: hypothetical protein WC935_00170 [Thermoleophilia bacterium]
MKDAIRTRLRQEIEAVGKQAEIDRASYVSAKELADMLGPNIRNTNALSGIISGLGIKTIGRRRSGERNAWMTEEQARLVIREVLSHPARTHTGDQG